LTAEKIVTRFIKGYPVREWHNVRGNKRNEALDCSVYAYAAAVRAGVAFMDIQTARPKQKHAIERKQIKKARRW
jgi:phage terminase large subunit GpA-like protein